MIKKILMLLNVAVVVFFTFFALTFSTSYDVVKNYLEIVFLITEYKENNEERDLRNNGKMHYLDEFFNYKKDSVK